MAIKPLNSVAGFSVGETPVSIILANGDVTTTNITTSGVSNLNSVGNVKIAGGSAGQFLQTDGNGNLTFATVDAATLSNGNSNIRILNNSNIVFTVGGNSNVVTFTGVGANIDGTLGVTGNISALGLKTNNLYYANGQPWDLQEAAGSNRQIQYNDGLNNFGASANFTFNSDTNLLTVVGNIDVLNANLGNLATANFVNVSSNVNVTDTVAAGNVRTDNLLYANGTPWDLQEAAGSNTQIQYNDGLNNFGASANFTYNDATQKLTVLGNAQFNNANLGNLATANFVDVANIANVGTLRTDNLQYANGQAWDLQQAAGANYEIQFNINDDFAASANLTYNDTTQQFTVLGNGQFNNANLGNLATANFANVASNTVTGNLTVNNAISGNTADFSGNVVVPNLTVNLELAGNTANFAGNIAALNADLGNLATANYVNVAQQINGNVANFSGNLTSLNANLGNLATANYVNVANDLTVTGNITGGNIIGALANGNSNVKVYNNSNIEVSVNGTANVVTFTDTEFLVVGEIKTTQGNILSNGNVTANGFLNGANASVTGEATFGSVVTDTITAPTGNLTISAAGTNENIYLVPSGTGVVDLGQHRITQLAAPLNPDDAATKEYVDAIGGSGLTIHAPVNVEANSALGGTYAVGGTTQTTTDITGGKTITFSSNHGLSVNDGIVWDNSFNGIIGGEAYWVQTVPALNQITIRNGYFGVEVTTLTNGTGLSESSRANPGVGATLTNSGANVALTVDGIAVANGWRVLVYSEANAAHNGIYEVTDTGSPSTAWVLTRATDMDKYIPTSPNGMGKGDYTFVTSGNTGAGESYVLTAPDGEIIIGTDNIVFTQFSSAGAYTAGNGISITGTIISANVDGVTTDIVGGNIVVKTSAQLITPNIGAATGTSLNVTGNVDANGLSITNLANVGGNLTVGGNVFANYAISANANVSGLNLTTNGNVEAGGNVIAGNVTANSTVFASNANVSGTTITDVLTVNNAINGNTANFTGNITAGNISTAGSGGNITGANVVSANTFTGNIVGNTANFSGNVEAGGVKTDNLYYANGSPWDLQQPAGSNNQIQYNDNGSFGASANFAFNDTTQVLTVNGTADVTTANISGTVNLGNANVNTAITWGSVTTTSITANQTIASFSATGVTGVEFLVKSVDSTGSKYGVATVIAVTDGTSVDYSTFGTVNLGGYTGALAVNIVGGQVRLQVTPSSSNSTVWTTQYRVI